MIRSAAVLDGDVSRWPLLSPLWQEAGVAYVLVSSKALDADLSRDEKEALAQKIACEGGDRLLSAARERLSLPKVPMKDGWKQ
jgi:hypothetical protein